VIARIVGNAQPALQWKCGSEIEFGKPAAVLHEGYPIE